jgi:hypothetical protein
MGEQERISLGQVCFEAMWQAQHAATGASMLHWADVRPADVRLWWEAGAAAVKAAVLAEQGALTGPKGMAETNKRVYNAVSATVTNMLTCMPSEDRTVPDAMAQHISRAVAAGVLEGLKAWEGKG